MLTISGTSWTARARAARSRPLGGSLAFAVAGALFLIYPALRPYSEENAMAGAQAFASPAWVVSHLCAVVGFILLPLGLLALRTALTRESTTPPAGVAFVVTWFGVGLTLPYYGAEAFALNALGERIVRTDQTRLLDLVPQPHRRRGPGRS